MRETEVKVVSELSNTQRISLKPTKQSITIQKEYRRNSTEDWITSKGIELSRSIIPDLIGELTNL